MTISSRVRRTAVLSIALAAAAACGGSAGNANDGAAAADSAGLKTTPPQPQGPMNMIDSSTRDSATLNRGDSLPATRP